MFTRCTLGPQFAPAFHRPFLRYVEGEPGGGDGGQQSKEPAFPADTPVKEMTPEQQAAYWQDKARKHEDRVKKYGDVTPEKLAELQKERDELRTKGLTADEKAVEAAKEAGRTEIRQELAKERIRNALEKALTGRVPDASALLDLDRSTLVKSDGTVDTDALKAWVEANSAAAGPGEKQKKNPDLGAGRRSAATVTPGDRGRGEAARRFNKPKTD